MKQKNIGCCSPSDASAQKKKPDLLLWGSLSVVASFYLLHLFFAGWLQGFPLLQTMAHTAHQMLHAIWWGILIGIFFIGLLSKVPREFILCLLGRGGTFNGILRATGAGLLFDLCNHGILLVGSKLYERGASGGQVVAFLLSSPWNSFSFTLIMIGLIGLNWTLLFIVLSMGVAILTGYFYDYLTKREVLPANAYEVESIEDFKFFSEAKIRMTKANLNRTFFKDIAVQGIQGSQMVVRWILFGIVLAMVLRVVFDPAQFEHYFGATLLGLSFTILFSTILEVCSEGSMPIAADLMNRARAPGNSFAFLMAGVATDYTEVMVLKETTQSWRFALFLPLLSLPQVIALAALMNEFAF